MTFTAVAHSPATSLWRRWPDWVAYAAAAWSIVHAALGVSWSLGGGGFPYGTANDPAARISILGGTTAETTAPVIAGLGFIGALVALAMARGWTGGVRRLLIGFGAIAAFALALAIPDYRVLVLVAYTPIVLIGALFGLTSVSDLVAAVTWPIVNQFVLIGGGVLWGLTTLAYWRRLDGACAYCGRTDASAGWTTPASAKRWGRWATYVAVAAPLIYAGTRYAWALGIPLGISEEFLRQGQEIGLWVVGAALATLAVAGGMLTLGLTQRWGEVFPGWIPLIGGRRVPPGLAVVPASIVALLVTSAGLMFWRMTLTGSFPLGDFGDLTLENAWAALLPELIWPIWGVALAAAALAYYLRRRGRCRVCGRG